MSTKLMSSLKTDSNFRIIFRHNFSNDNKMKSYLCKAKFCLHLPLSVLKIGEFPLCIIYFPLNLLLNNQQSYIYLRWTTWCVDLHIDSKTISMMYLFNVSIPTHRHYLCVFGNDIEDICTRLFLLGMPPSTQIMVWRLIISFECSALS